MDYDYGFVPGCVVNIIIPSQKLLALPLLFRAFEGLHGQLSLANSSLFQTIKHNFHLFFIAIVK